MTYAQCPDIDHKGHSSDCSHCDGSGEVVYLEQMEVDSMNAALAHVGFTEEVCKKKLSQTQAERLLDIAIGKAKGVANDNERQG